MANSRWRVAQGLRGPRQRRRRRRSSGGSLDVDEYSTVACWDVEGDLGECHGRVAFLHSALLDEDEDLGHAAVRLVVKELLGHGVEVGVHNRACIRLGCSGCDCRLRVGVKVLEEVPVAHDVLIELLLDGPYRLFLAT